MALSHTKKRHEVNNPNKKPGIAKQFLVDSFSTLPTGGMGIYCINMWLLVSIAEPELNKNFYHIYLLQPNKAQHFFQDYLPK